MKRTINPESAPVRVYHENGEVVVCVKRQPSLVLSPAELMQVQYLLTLDSRVLDTAAYLIRELGPNNASDRLKVASEKAGLVVDREVSNGGYHGV